jgi:uncharacterized protein (DUF3084 family)
MKNISLLEKRVHQAVERLKQLSEDRRRLEDELRALRGQLEQVQAVSDTVSDDDNGQHEWSGQRTQIGALVRETLSELTAD